LFQGRKSRWARQTTLRIIVVKSGVLRVPIQENTRLIKRVRRILGQVESIERRIGHSSGCADVLLLIATTRGALNALMTEVIEYHIRANLIEPQLSDSATQAGEELIDIVRSYLK
jgi:DNA-binding FrmR family transcriptional regulator